MGWGLGTDIAKCAQNRLHPEVAQGDETLLPWGYVCGPQRCPKCFGSPSDAERLAVQEDVPLLRRGPNGEEVRKRSCHWPPAYGSGEIVADVDTSMADLLAAALAKGDLERLGALPLPKGSRVRLTVHVELPEEVV